MHRQFTYLALGDSYTIGENILLQQSFPYQVVQLLRSRGHTMTAPEIVAKTGWTTEELQQGMENYLFLEKYDFVSLLIGVNNQYRGQNILLYKKQFEALLKKSIHLAGGKKDHVFVVSIPDYSVTPFAVKKDPEKIAKEIDEYNSLKMAICIQYKISFIDITSEAREAEKNPALLAADGLHPSAEGYAAWALKLAKAAEKTLKK